MVKPGVITPSISSQQQPDRRIPRYISWNTELEAWSQDALNSNWTNMGRVYVSSPWSLLPKVLQKIKMDKAKATVITPNWPRWSQSTVRNYKSAILQLFSNEEREATTINRDFQQFIKRLRNYDIDLALLLKHLHNLGSNDTMSITDLTAKTCFLLPVCCLRADDIKCIDNTQSMVKDATLTLTVLFPKELRGGQNIIKPVVIKSHPKEECCPVRAYMEYRRCTETIDDLACKDHPKIASKRYTPLISFIKEPTQSLQPEWISHYIHDIMRWILRLRGNPSTRHERWEPRWLSNTVFQWRTLSPM
ncbi:hypothetical protein BG015_009482, partial [Linnemannia schmuckeri]